MEINIQVETYQPLITMELPGPKARALIETDSQVTSPSLPRANLTEYAMNWNMEMGVLIQGGELPTLVHQHFQELISLGYLALSTV